MAESQYTAPATYTITFPSLSEAEVNVSVNGVKLSTSDYSIANYSTSGSGTVTITATVNNGDIVRVYRDTDVSTPEATFAAGASIAAADLNNNNLQLRYKLQEKAVSGDISTNAVTTDIIRDSAVTTDKINDLAVTTEKLADGAVTNPKLADNSVSLAKMQDDSVDTAEIVDSAVITAKLATDAVTQAKIANDAVGTAEIIDLNVTTAKLANSAVTTAKIADNAVTSDKIAANSITGDQIADSSLSGAKITDGTLDIAAVKAGDFVTLAEQNASPDAAGSDDEIASTAATNKRYDVLYQAGTPSGTDWTTGKLWYDENNNKTLSVWNGSSWITISNNVPEIANDTSPALGGDLDVATFDIVSSDNNNIDITPNGTGEVVISTASVSDLTSGRVVLAGSSGALEDNSALTFDGTTLTTNSLTASGTVSLSGIAYPSSDGTEDQVIATDGNGNLSFTSISNISNAGIQDIIDDTTPQLGGNLDVNGNTITSTSNANVVLNPDGTGTVDVSTSRITSVTDPTGAQDAATKNYVDTSSANTNYVAVSGDDMTGALAMGTNKITGVGDPTDAQDVATKNYVDTNSIFNVVEDTTPQLGGDLDVNGNTITSASDGNVVIDPNGTGIISLGSDVGIGTSSPDKTLHVSGSSLFIAATGSGTVNIVSTNNQSSAGNKIAFFGANRFDADEEMAYIKPLMSGNSGGSGNVQTGHLTFGTSGSERLRIDSSGNVGIGTSNPGALLDVNGGSLIVQDSSGNTITLGTTVGNGNDSTFILQKARGGTGTIAEVQDGDDLGTIQWQGYYSAAYQVNSTIRAEAVIDGSYSDKLLYDSDTHVIRTSNTDRVTVGSNGRVGIGTTDPYESLSVRGTGDQINLDLNSTTDDDYSAITWNTSTANLGDNQGCAIRGVRTASGAKGALDFLTRGSDSTLTQRVRIEDNGVVDIAGSEVVLQGNEIGGTQVTIADNAKATITPPRIGAGWVFVTTHGNTVSPQTNAYGRAYVDWGNTPVINSAAGGSAFETSTAGPPTGTTGSDNHATLFAGGTSGKVYLENRLGGTFTFQITFL